MNCGCTRMRSRWVARLPPASGLGGVAEREALKRRAWTEVEQEPNLHVRRMQVVEELLSVCFAERLSGLDLDDYPLPDHQIGTKYSNPNPFVPDVDHPLALDADSSLAQLVGERSAVDGLEEAVPELIVDSVERTDHCSGRVIGAAGSIRVHLIFAVHPRESA